MGRGGYIGGSTIVADGRWSSFDPADARQKETGFRRGESRGSSPGHHAPGRPKTNKQPIGTKKKLDIGKLRIMFMTQVIDAALRTQPAPIPPKAARAEIELAVQKAGGLIAWVRAQREFTEILDKRRKKFASKKGQESKIGRSVAKESTPGKRILPVVRVKIAENNGSHVLELKRERDRCQAALVEARSHVQDCRAALARIDHQLKELGL